MIAFYLDESHVQRQTLHDTGFGVKWNEVLAYIEANLHANIQIEELAKFAFLHPNYFITSFKSIMGCSPIQYVTNRRIAHAMRLLMDTELPVAAIAKQVGMQVIIYQGCSKDIRASRRFNIAGSASKAQATGRILQRQQARRRTASGTGRH
jgi:AraC-like DNA-binding protein